MFFIEKDDGEDDLVERVCFHFIDTTFSPYSESKKAKEQCDAQDTAVKIITAKVLAELLNSRRLLYYDKLVAENKTIPGISWSDIGRKLGGFRTAWLGRDRAVYKNWQDFWPAEGEKFILNLVVDEAMYDLEEERHRKAVVRGDEEPTDDDRDWLAVEAQARRDEADALIAAAEAARQQAERLTAAAEDQS